MKSLMHMGSHLGHRRDNQAGQGARYPGEGQGYGQAIMIYARAYERDFEEDKALSRLLFSIINANFLILLGSLVKEEDNQA